MYIIQIFKKNLHISIEKLFIKLFFSFYTFSLDLDLHFKSSWIRIRIEKLLDPYPDPQKMNVDPQPWYQYRDWITANGKNVSEPDRSSSCGMAIPNNGAGVQKPG